MNKTDFLKKHRNDLLLIGGILAVALIAFAVFVLTMKKGDMVTVSVNGVEKFSYSLNENIKTVITTGDNGERSNVLVIQNGEAYVESADCPDKICVGHRSISKVGETIVCLPHKVVVAVVDGN
ncbi:MAG: NusG domain II-containing protein [Clostridia bacterium]|nr:NusG domain II-containing protein [Clostridia bacterium]